MDSPAWFNIATLLIAVSAMGISSAFTLRALRLSQNANQLPVVTNLLAPHRDPVFLAKEDFVNAHIGEYDAVVGFHGLPQPMRAHALTVCQQYQLLGYLSRYELADARIIASQVRHNALRTWAAVEAHVRAERDLRGGEFTFLNSFEDFVRSAQLIDPESEMVWRNKRHPAWRQWQRVRNGRVISS